MLSKPNVLRSQAFTLAEVCVACAVAAMFALAAFSTNQRLLNSVRDQREDAAASMVLQERMERFRAASYSQVASTQPTYNNYVQNNILTYNPSPSPTPTPAFPGTHGTSQGQYATFSEGPLGSLIETVTISGYQAAVSPSPSVLGSGQMQWIRDTSSGDGHAHQQSNPDNNLATEYDILKVDILLQWTGTGGRSRSRELSALFGKGNIGQ
jgi:type II secretory pathway pseudopilin PulG